MPGSAQKLRNTWGEMGESIRVGRYVDMDVFSSRIPYLASEKCFREALKAMQHIE